MHSGLAISRNSKHPAYRQIVDQVKERVAAGDWPPGYEIPSIRQLAADLRVSTITIRRAYLELERNHILATQQGRQSVVSDDGQSVSSDLIEKEFRDHLREAARLAVLSGWTEQQLHEELGRVHRRLSRRTA